jgi:uncharacterized protein (TIGR02099 family)
MKDLTLKQGLNTVNLLLVTTFLVLALYSALGQQIFPYIGQYRVDIEKYISAELNSDVNINTLSGGMDILTPSIHLEGVTMSSSENQSTPSLSIAAIDAILDPQASLLNLTPVFKSVRISGLYINIPSDRKRESDKDNSALIQSFIETLLLQQNLELNNVTVELSKEGGPERLHLDNVSMTGDGFHRLMTGSIIFGSDNKIKAGLRLYSEGSPYDLDEFYARGVLDLPKLDVDYWLEKITDVSIFDEFSASSQLSIEFQNGLLNYAKLNLASRTVSLPNVKTFKNVSTELWLKQKSSDTWTVWLENALFTIDSKKWNLSDLALKLSKNLVGNRWHSYIAEADINETYELIDSLNLMPKSVADIYSDLMPSGGLNNLNIIFQTDSANPDAPAILTLAGALNGVSTKAHESIPALKNINGVIAAEKKSGRVQFEGQNIEIDFPEIYSNPFEISQGKGQVDWRIFNDGFQVLGNGLNVQMPGVKSLKGGFDVFIPTLKNGKTGYLELNLAASDTSVKAHPVLVPKVTPKSLNEWFASALQGGMVNAGQFYFYDSIAPGASDPVLELYLDTENSELTYLEGWPSIKDITGKVLVKNTDVFGTFTTGSSLGGKLSSAQIIYKYEPEPYLWVGANMVGSSDGLFSYFKVTPLKNLIGDVFKNWSMQGTQTTSLGLKIPMEGSIENIKVDALSKLSHSTLNLADIGLSVSDVNGSISYKTSTGLVSPKLTASMWGESIAAAISTEMFDRNMKTDIQFSGMLNAGQLKEWLKLSLLEPVSGKSLVNGSVLIDTRDQGFTGLRFGSSLEGVSIDLPGNFSKNKKEKLELIGSFALGEKQVFKLSYDKRVNLALALEGGRLTSGQVYLGEIEAYVPSEPGIEISGHLARVNFDKWLDVWRRIQTSPYSTSNSPSGNSVISGAEVELAPNPIRKLDVSVDRFYYSDFSFEQVNAIINQSNNVWEFNVDAPVAKGVITLDPKKPLKVALDYFHWPALTDNSDTKKDSDPLANIDPMTFPEMNMNVSEVFIGPRNFGRWKLDVSSIDNGVRFSNIDGLIKKLGVKGSVYWVKPKNAALKQVTTTDLQLTSNDVGGIQKGWRIKPAVEAKYAKINTIMKWSGSPAKPKVDTISGKLDIHLKDGRFIEAGDAGSLSAFGLLNFSAIGRRLRLDFSDVYESGFHFDDVKGKAVIDKGIIKVVDTLEVDGPSAKFAASGTINLNTKELNQELSATFPITGSLPLMAIIAGFAPPIAASLFVGERLVGAEIEKFTSATYKLSGTWDEPKLELVKRFDNDIEGKKDRSFWYRMKNFFGVGDNS